MARDARATYIKRHAPMLAFGLAAWVLMLALIDLANDVFSWARLAFTAAVYVLAYSACAAVVFARRRRYGLAPENRNRQ